MDNPISWVILLMALIFIGYYVHQWAINEYDRDQAEISGYWASKGEHYTPKTLHKSKNIGTSYSINFR
jgi:hypothetical protein